MELGEKKIAEIEKASLEAAQELLAETPKLTGEFFLAREGEKETIIATIDFPALEKWRAKVKKVYPEVEFHFPHTTLYKNEAAGKGIPISSKEVFENLTEKLDDETNEILRNTFEKSATPKIVNDKIINIVKSLGFPLDEVLVFASGIMDVFGLKKADDIDLVVSKSVFDKIENDKSWTSAYKESVGKVMYRKTVDGMEIETPGDYDWVDWYDKKVGFASLIERAENLGGVNFNNMHDLLAWKKSMNREKDQRDIALIEKHLQKPTQNVPTISLTDLTNPLDKWIVSRVHELRNHITKYLDEYNLPDAMSAILPMIDDASNWYVRRSRRRFWKSEDDGDKNDAYRTLHYVLTYLSQILAPFVPFLAEELYQKLTGGESVHLLDWPRAMEIDEEVLGEMGDARRVIELGLAHRMAKSETEEQIKVRQPLAKLEYWRKVKLDDFYEQIIADEVNVKQVVWHSFDAESMAVKLDKVITPELKREGQSREVIRLIQKARKDAGLNVDDRIVVNITTLDKELQKAIDEHRETIATEILAIKFAENDGYQVTAQIDGVDLTIQLKKETSA
jgi:hypothetical protein